MSAVRLAVGGLLAAALLAACDSTPSDPWIVTSTHSYPPHSRTTFVGQCPAGLTGAASMPANCTRTQVEYPALMEVCATRRGSQTCWYIPKRRELVYTEQRVGHPVEDFESYLFTNPHPSPTNEWDHGGDQ